jgi:5-methylcytosine-specific restriction endonuclease McrA
VLPDRQDLAQRLETGATLDALAAAYGVDRSTIRRWLARAGLETAAQRRRREGQQARAAGERRMSAECPRHGLVVQRRDARGTFRCPRCAREAVVRRRKRVKEILVQEHGGACMACGYDRCVTALEFHHVDPASKAFAIGFRGIARSLERARAEASKCVLLCSNCHAEVEAGLRLCPDLGGPLSGAPAARGAAAPPLASACEARDQTAERRGEILPLDLLEAGSEAG